MSWWRLEHGGGLPGAREALLSCPISRESSIDGFSLAENDLPRHSSSARTDHLSLRKSSRLFFPQQQRSEVLQDSHR